MADCSKQDVYLKLGKKPTRNKCGSGSLTGLDNDGANPGEGVVKFSDLLTEELQNREDGGEGIGGADVEYENVYYINPFGDDTTGDKGFRTLPFQSLHAANRDVSVTAGDMFYITKADYAHVVDNQGNNAEATFGGTATAASFLFDPGTTFSTTGDGQYSLWTDVVSATFGTFEQRNFEVQAPYVDFNSNNGGSIPLMIGMYHPDSSFRGKVGDLNQSGSGRSWVIQVGCDLFDLEVDDITGQNGETTCSFTNSQPTAVKDGAYNRLKVNRIFASPSLGNALGVLRVQMEQSVAVTNSTFIYDVGELNIEAGMDSNAIWTDKSFDGSGTQVLWRIDKIIDNGGSPVYSSDTDANIAGYSVVNTTFPTVSADYYENVVYDLGDVVSPKHTFNFPCFLGAGQHVYVNNTTILCKVDTAYSAEGNNFKIGASGANDIDMTNGKILVTGDFTADNNANVVIKDLVMDANSEIRFKDCRFTCNDAGSPNVSIQNITGAGADNIIFENCTFINDAASVTIESLDAGAYNVKIQNCFANSLSTDANITEQVTAIIRDTNVK